MKTKLRIHCSSTAFAAALLVGGILVWSYWPRNQVQIVRVSPTANAGLNQDVSVTTFNVSAAVDEISWSPDSAKLAVLTKPGKDKRGQDRSVLTFQVADERQEVVHTTDAALLGLAYWPDGSIIASASWRTGPKGECEILLWGPATRQKAGQLIGAPLDGLGVPMTSDPLSIAVSPDGRWLAAGTKLVDAKVLAGAHIGGEVCVWELTTKHLKWFNRTTHTDIVQSVVFSNDGKTLASAGIDKLIRIWDVETGQLKATLTGAAWHGIACVAFSPDGKLLASGGAGEEDGGSVRVWDVDSGLMKQRFSAFRPHSNVRVAFAPDGQSLMAVGLKKESNEAEFRVHRWEPMTGQYRGMLAEHTGSPRTMSISRDGMLAVGTFEGQIVIVTLPK